MTSRGRSVIASNHGRFEAFHRPADGNPFPGDAMVTNVVSCPQESGQAVENGRVSGGRRPRLLDLFCGAGGAAVGYSRAGFEVVGVDIKPQPNYPFEFIQADALGFLADTGEEWVNAAAIHASPPCQHFSDMTNCRPGLAAQYPDLIEPTRERLIATGLPYVIENVPGSPLIDPVVLCGQMFGLELYRHRLFESNFQIGQSDHPAHVLPASKAGHWKPGTIMSVAGHVSPIAKAREVMGINWTTRDELGEAIPPAYTEHVGNWLLAEVEARAELPEAA